MPAASQPKRVVLASASPRRRELLGMLGIEFEVDASGVDESLPETHPDPAQLVRDASLIKARDVARRHQEAVVLGSDTVVTLDGHILGKPADADDAARMLRQLSGRVNVVHSGVAIIAPGGREGVDSESTRVEMAALTDEDIAWYVGTGEPLDKAGAYAIQGLGARFIQRIEGCYFTVVGLPVPRMIELARGLGIRL